MTPPPMSQLPAGTTAYQRGLSAVCMTHKKRNDTAVRPSSSLGHPTRTRGYMSQSSSAWRRKGEKSTKVHEDGAGATPRGFTPQELGTASTSCSTGRRKQSLSIELSRPQLSHRQATTRGTQGIPCSPTEGMLEAPVQFSAPTLPLLHVL